MYVFIWYVLFYLFATHDDHNHERLFSESLGCGLAKVTRRVRMRVCDLTEATAPTTTPTNVHPSSNLSESKLTLVWQTQQPQDSYVLSNIRQKVSVFCEMMVFITLCAEEDPVFSSLRWLAAPVVELL